LGRPTQTSTNLVVWFLNIVVWHHCDEKTCIVYEEVFIDFASGNICIYNVISLVPDPWKEAKTDFKTSPFITPPGTLDTCGINATIFHPEHVTHLDTRFHFRMCRSLHCALFYHYTLKNIGLFFYPNPGLSLLGTFFFSVLVVFVLPRSWIRRNNPVFG